MSIRLISAVWADETITSQSDRLVMLALADYANDRGQCWPSLTRIAKRTSHTVRGVIKVLARLEKEKRITVKRAPGGSRYETNHYQILPRTVEHGSIDGNTVHVNGSAATMERQCTTYKGDPSYRSVSRFKNQKVKTPDPKEAF